MLHAGIGTLHIDICIYIYTHMNRNYHHMSKKLHLKFYLSQ